MLVMFPRAKTRYTALLDLAVCGLTGFGISSYADELGCQLFVGYHTKSEVGHASIELAGMGRTNSVDGWRKQLSNTWASILPPQVRNLSRAFPLH